MNNNLKELKENREHGDYILPFITYRGQLDNTYPQISMHWHPEMEITYITDGSCNYNINLTNYVVDPGDIIIIKPQSLHSLTLNNNQSVTWNTIVFNFNMLNSSITDGCLLKYIAPIINETHELPIIIKKDSVGYSKIFDTITSIFDCYENQNDAFELELKSYLFHLLALLYKYNLVKFNDNKKELSSDASSKIKTILNYINNNFQKEISIDDLANLCQYSQYHFMRFFKKHLGVTTIQYINNVRLEKASILLSSTDSSIMEISLETGFDNLSYFNKLFKRKYHITPKEFRRNTQNLI